MQDYISIGSAPYDEDCAQVGAPDYHEKMTRETRAYINQLKREFGPPPEGARLTVKSFPHDFGSYHEVVCYYDDSLPDSLEYALKLESESPARWDAIAEVEILPKFLRR